MGDPKLEAYRRGAGSVDPGADHARQLPYTLRQQKNEFASMLAEALTLQPPFGKIFKHVHAPDDSAAQPLEHGLGRKYVGAVIISYETAGSCVTCMSPTWVDGFADSAVHMYFRNELTPLDATTNARSAVYFDVWVF